MRRDISCVKDDEDNGLMEKIEKIPRRMQVNEQIKRKAVEMKNGSSQKSKGGMDRKEKPAVSPWDSKAGGEPIWSSLGPPWLTGENDNKPDIWFIWSRMENILVITIFHFCFHFVK